eukprot:6186111-Pleurochrysis_carterae.AAC.2
MIADINLNLVLIIVNIQEELHRSDKDQRASTNSVCGLLYCFHGKPLFGICRKRFSRHMYIVIFTFVAPTNAKSQNTVMLSGLVSRCNSLPLQLHGGFEFHDLRYKTPVELVI